MPTGHDAVVGAPVVHDFVGAAEGALTGQGGREPCRRPSRVSALVERVVYVVG